MSNFNDVNHMPLRTYNRCVVAANLKQDAGQAALEDYLDQFSPEEQADIQTMYKLIRTHGVRRIQKMVTSGLNFSNDDYVGEDIV